MSAVAAVGLAVLLRIENVQLAGDVVRAAAVRIRTHFFAASQSVRLRASDSLKDILPLATPLWPRRTSWLRRLVVRPMMASPQEADLSQGREEDLRVPLWLRASRSAACTVHPRPRDRALLENLIDVWTAASPPVAHEAFPPFQHQMLSHCRQVCSVVEDVMTPLVCSPLCLLPLLGPPPMEVCQR
ncbi:hypothetical protein NECAME_07366 [Necator americanus]|uniref:Uncharacterized protein n=1 Tax=Necator americanus TaxID=51031 RepID=W2TPC7_NECAM|nr:hypothetical protein NECAME_07366 [Necator americanus]ETN83544.1 hypothetical protein NECAME_07366 [Necator americanus]